MDCWTMENLKLLKSGVQFIGTLIIETQELSKEGFKISDWLRVDFPRVEENHTKSWKLLIETNFSFTRPANGGKKSKHTHTHTSGGGGETPPLSKLITAIRYWQPYVPSVGMTVSISLGQMRGGEKAGHPLLTSALANKNNKQQVNQ